MAARLSYTILALPIFLCHKPDKTNMEENNDIKSELEKLRAENAALKRSSARGLSLKISDKGGLSVYGLGRFPVTLYKEQWLKLLDLSDDIRTFIAANSDKLKAKGETTTAP
jgi:hypothetical protein